MEDVTWTTSSPVNIPSGAKKHAFVKEIDIPNDMPDGQKSFALSYNSMREMLMNNGLMNKK